MNKYKKNKFNRIEIWVWTIFAFWDYFVQTEFLKKMLFSTIYSFLIISEIVHCYPVGSGRLREVFINDILIYLEFLFIVLDVSCKQTNK